MRSWKWKWEAVGREKGRRAKKKKEMLGLPWERPWNWTEQVGIIKALLGCHSSSSSSS